MLRCAWLVSGVQCSMAVLKMQQPKSFADNSDTLMDVR